MKGLPLAYNRDLQEDKERVFDSADTVLSCLKLTGKIVSGATLNQARIAKGIEEGFLDATVLMEHLIARGVPQRTAHHAIGSLVAKATEQGTTLRGLSVKQLQAADAALDERSLEILGTENAVKAMTSAGSTGPAEVRKQWQVWERKLFDE